MNLQASGVVKRALSQVGYKEGPNNQSKYGSWAGLPEPELVRGFRLLGI